jgi:hypothetical protein
MDITNIANNVTVVQRVGLEIELSIHKGYKSPALEEGWEKYSTNLLYCQGRARIHKGKCRRKIRGIVEKKPATVVAG